jgi:hypothetical protein
VAETLARLGVLDETELSTLAGYHRPTLINRRDMVVGEVRAVFDIDFD